MKPTRVSSLLGGGRHETNTTTETVSRARPARGQPSQASGAVATRQHGPDQRRQRIDAQPPQTSHPRDARHGGQAQGS